MGFSVKSCQERGLSLAEVLIAMIVISLAVLATVSSQAFGLRALSVDPVRQRASEVANRALATAELQLRQDFSQSVAHPLRPDPTNLGFQIEVTETIEDAPRNILKRVTVRTTWEGKNGEESLEFWTVFIDEEAVGE